MIASQKIGKSFMGALNYNLKKLYHTDPEMRAELLATNFADIDPNIIRQEVDLMKSMKPNLSRYVYHTSINFPKEDLLDNDKLLAIANDYLKESGFTNNQYMIFRHHDADHPHIHLLVNRISFDGRVVSDSNNFKKSEAILRSLELKYGLTQVQDSEKAETKAVKKGELEMVIRTGKPSDKMLLQEKMKALLDRPGRPKLTITDLIRQGQKEGIQFLFNQATTGRITGITYFHEGFKIKGQALGSRYKWAEVIKIVGYEQNRDSKAISEANDRTRAAYGQFGPAAGERTSSAGTISDQTGSERTRDERTSSEKTRDARTESERTRSERTKSGRTSDLGTALPDPAELGKRRQIDEQYSRGTAEDMAADGPAGTGSGTADGGMEKAAESADTDRVLLDNWGNVYIPPFAVGIADDEDDALRKRKRRGIGR